MNTEAVGGNALRLVVGRIGDANIVLANGTQAQSTETSLRPCMPFRCLCALLGLLTLTELAPAQAMELKLITPGALRSSLVTLLPQFEAASGHKVSVTLSPALAVAGRLNREAFDVAIMGQGSANALEKQGLLVATAVIARSGVGVFVRRGDPKPDVGDVDSFVRALMNAKVITYSDPALGGSASTYVSTLLAKLDTTGAIKAKTKLAIEYRSIANMVAAGGIDLALNQITEILADARLELVGPLPAPIQRYTNYAIAVVVGSANHAVGKALIDFLASPAAADVMRQNGFEPR
jgi:molybdate transport system substrate-binding protein